MASNDHDSSAWDQPVYKHPPSMESPNNISANTSNSSSASDVLRRSSAPHVSQSEQHGKHNSSDASSANSSISSSGSMRVRIKAKYLRERRSPFETGGSSSTQYLPPALPGNLPEGYEVQRDVADVQRHNIIEDVTSAKDDGATSGQVLSSAEGYKQGGLEQVSNAASKNGVDDEFSEITRPPVLTGHLSHDDHNQSTNQRSSSIHPVTQLPMSSSTNMGITHKKTSGILRQGAPTSSSAPFHGSTSGHPRDVRVTHFSKGQRQQAMRDQLLKRSENSKPTKRYYQPKLISSGRPSASKPEETRTAHSDAGTMATATAAAAAAVAATVPLLKTQSDLESKMNHIMEKLSVLEHVGHSAPPPPPWVYPMGQGWGGGGYDARHDLGEMTQRRLSELEELQRQQREMQLELRALSQINADRGIEVSNGMPPHQGTHTFSDHLSPGASQTRPMEPKQDEEVLQKTEAGKPQVRQSGSDLKTSSRSTTTKVPLAKMDSGEPLKPPKKHVKYTPAVTVHRLPQGQASSGDQQRSVHQGGVREHHATQTSPLETPAPRRHAPRPHSKEIRSTGLSNLGRGLLEEILSSHDEDERTRDLRQRVQTNHLSALNVTSSNSRNPNVEKESESEEHLYARPSNESHPPVGSTSPTVKRAQRIAQQLGELNQQVKQTIQTGGLKEEGRKRNTLQEASPDRHYKEISKKLRQEAERDMDRRKQAWLEPAPLDDYLRRTRDVHAIGPAFLPPPRSHVTMSPSQHNAPILTPLCAEAQALLKKVQTSKGMLEANLDTVARTQDDEHFYQVIQSICREGEGSDFARMKQAVDEQIAAIDSEIKRELQQGRLHINKPSGRHSPPTKLLPDRITQRPHQQQLKQLKGQQPPTSKPVGQQSAGPLLGKMGKKKVQAKIDTGLRRPRRGEEQEDDLTERNKENLKERTTVLKSPPRPTSKPTGRGQDDERYLKHIYGHTRLQSQRSTLKDAPYLHFANQTPTKTKKMAAHHASPVQAPIQRPVRTQTETHKSRGVGTHQPVTSAPQYYFSPYPAGPSHAPVIAPTHHPSPADGQLIPMAIPLREPRLGVGMAQPVTIISNGRGAPARPEDGSNVALIDVKAEDEKKMEPEKRDLTVQRLPNVDIDSNPATPAPSQERVSPGTQPPYQVNKQDIPPHANVTEEDRLASANPSEKEKEKEEVVVEPSSPEIPGISMEGMQTARQPSYHGPPFPPQQLPPSHHQSGGIQPSSDHLAAGIRRMEMLQTRAVDWVEQELMSRFISGTHLRQSERLQQPSTSHGARPVSQSSSEDSDHVVGALGGGGLQLFVDAGQPVDPTLVNSLVQQVLEEKIALCLGRHQRERSSVAMPTVHDARRPTPQPVGQHSPIPTPEPTPPASPLIALSREPSPTPRDRIPTPDASEIGEAASGGAESETESWKDLMKDSENSNEEANTIAAPGPEAVTTPPTTPPPISTQSPPPILGEEPQTPVPSPPSSPTSLVGVPSELMVTPTPSPEPRSPVASEPEEDAFQATLRTPSPEPRLPSPLPPPPKAATPAPPSVESSSTTESTPPDSTITHTSGREVSEGEWLVSEREEGRVPDETLFGVPEMAAFDESSQSSTTSTVKGPTDPDKDQEEPRSEGEVDPNRLKLTRDPVVALLSRLRQAPSGVPHPGHIPPAGMQPTAASSPHSISSASSSSVGEVSEGQRPSLMPPAERLLYQEAYHSKPPKRVSDHRRSLGEVGSNGEEEEDGIFPPAKDGVKKGTDDAPSNQNILTPSPKASASQLMVAPSPVARVIQVGRQRTPEQIEDEEVEGQGDLAEADMTAGGTLIDRPLPASLFSSMVSDPGRHTMTPDAMNMDGYLQSGYLSQTFSQSEGGLGGATSDFESSQFLGQTNNSVTGLNASGAGPRGSSLLATSGMFSEDSLEVGVAMRGREERMTQRSFQVTLPSIAGLDEKEEESASEGEVHGGETISDVSEITL